MPEMPVSLCTSRTSFRTLPPRDIIEVYREANGPKAMWVPLKARTIRCFVKGCQNLAMLWESAWKEGGGSKIAQSKLVAIETETLSALYNDRKVATAMWLDDMVDAGIGIAPS